jgi:hypothetical protein
MLHLTNHDDPAGIAADGRERAGSRGAAELTNPINIAAGDEV